MHSQQQAQQGRRSKERIRAEMEMRALYAPFNKTAYSIWKDCGPRVYAWKASAMNIREFNHNPALGERFPTLFNTCHYQVRSEAQLIKRIESRLGLSQGAKNYHFDYMKNNIKDLYIKSNSLHYDDGGNLSLDQTFDWSKYVYGSYEKLMEQLKNQTSSD